MSRYMQYAMVASQEALESAHWHPSTELERESTVRSPGLTSADEFYS